MCDMKTFSSKYLKTHVTIPRTMNMFRFLLVYFLHVTIVTVWWRGSDTAHWICSVRSFLDGLEGRIHSNDSSGLRKRQNRTDCQSLYKLNAFSPMSPMLFTSVAYKCVPRVINTKQMWELWQEHMGCDWKVDSRMFQWAFSRYYSAKMGCITYVDDNWGIRWEYMGRYIDLSAHVPV